MSTINKILLKSKIKGSILGSLVGDCFGAPFKGDVFSSGGKLVLQKYFDKLDGPYFAAPVKKYTENSSMTKCVGQYLTENPTKWDPTALAKNLVKEYFQDPKRGYNESMIDVFHQLRFYKFDDPFKPADNNATKSVSNDNSAATRTSPIALNYCEKYPTMIEVVKKSSEITHTHPEGVNGAILQCIAVHQCLAETESKLDASDFIDRLIEKMGDIEKDEEGLGIGDPTPYKNRLQLVKDILKSNRVMEDEELIQTLGQNSLALFSVPSAIYCFLRSQSEIASIKTENPFRRTLQYAISLGGDTDSIAAMAGSLAGAFYGDKLINENLVKHCEDSQTFISLADKLHSVK